MQQIKRKRDKIMKQVKVRKNFSIGNKKFKSLIETSENYDIYVAQNTHDEGKIVKGMKFFLFKKGFISF